MLPIEIRRMYDILVSFLGDSKSQLDETLQVQFSCPKCQERDGYMERNKYHLEVNIAKGLYHCWKCSSIDDGMHGSVYRLIRKYGNPELLKQYKDAINEFRQTSLYKLKFDETDFMCDYADIVDDSIHLPDGFVKFQKGVNDSSKAFLYLQNRGIDWQIIEDYHLGFTGYRERDKKGSNRVILPSFDKYGELNYWTGRDFTGNDKRQRYDNPKIDRKSIIFNEEKVVWNADITLVEGPFDSIVVPNSIPLLGKTLDKDGKTAFTLTIQTREQHIKREKATSNICSNQSLMALCSTLYLSLLGKKGFRQVGVISAQNAHKLADMLKQKGIKVLNKDFYNEFVIETDDASEFLENLDKKGILGGLKLDDKKVLVAVTEMNTEEELESYCK